MKLLVLRALDLDSRGSFLFPFRREQSKPWLVCQFTRDRSSHEFASLLNQVVNSFEG
jgi:hypothetical protein